MTLEPDSRTVERLRQATRILALTGAGISAESGIPTFREAQTGLWQRYNPLDLATPEAFARDPDTVWRWYQWRRELVDAAQPNAGHCALARWEQLAGEGWLLATQNVDGLHQRAGSRAVVELHGNLQRTVCAGYRHVFDPVAARAATPPECPRCGAPGRPDVVWFGETLPEDAYGKALEAAERADVVLSVGTSSLVHPAAGLPLLAADNGALLLEVNPQPTPLTAHADCSLRGTAAAVLPALVRRLFGSGDQPPTRAQRPPGQR